VPGELLHKRLADGEVRDPRGLDLKAVCTSQVEGRTILCKKRRRKLSILLF
jgi:hypothetical protein